MASQKAYAGNSGQFRFFLKPHRPPEYPVGVWHLEDDGLDEFDIVDERGRVLASIDEKNFSSREEMLATIQCMLLIPQLVPAVYTAMHALYDNMEDHETSRSIAEKLSNLLRSCYSFPQ